MQTTMADALATFSAVQAQLAEAACMTLDLLDAQGDDMATTVEPITIRTGCSVCSLDPEDENAQGVVTQVSPDRTSCRVLWDVPAGGKLETWCGVNQVRALADAPMPGGTGRLELDE